MTKLKELAVSLNLFNKIDWLCDDTEYFEKWERKLEEYSSLKKKVNIDTNLRLETVRAKSFFNWTNLFTEIDRNIYEEYDLEALKVALEEQPQTAQSVSSALTSHPQSSHQDVLTTYIIDVDWETTPNGAAMFMYTRDSENITRLVTIPFQDYFYIKLAKDVTESMILKKINSYSWYLKNKRYVGDGECNDRKDPRQLKTKLVVKTEVVYDLKSLYGFQPESQTFLKITTVSPTVTNDLFNGLARKPECAHWQFFEVNTDFVNKFLTKHKLSACAPVTIKNVLDNPVNPYSYCDFMVESTEACITADVPTETKPYTPKYIFWDIEVLSLDVDVFPTAEAGCPVIQISYLLSNGTDEVKRGVLCLHETPGEHFESFDYEYQMLIRFAQIVIEFQPDCLVGYNSNNFDMPYIIDRMRMLGIHSWASQFTRRKGFSLDYKKVVTHSNQFGSRDVIKYVSPGLLMMDQMELLKSDVTKRLDSYALKHVCSIYLKDDNKEDLRYRDIPELFKTVEGRQKIANYCLKDGELLLSLEKAIMFGVNLQSMTRVLGSTMDITANRGLVFKLMGKLKQYTERFNFLIPSFTKAQKPVFEGNFQGALVLDPDVGFYEDPIVVLDYASLYPSLMIYYNLSYDSIVLDTTWAENNKDKCETMHNGVIFVKPEIHTGILPRLEQELGLQRKAAKKRKAAAEKGSVEAVIFDGEQNAIKIVMNSLYGMSGSPTATIPCVEIAASITAQGRYNLLSAKKYVEENYCKFTGQPKSAKVIYGDSDSIFIKMPDIDVETAIKYGKLLEKNITRDLYHKANALCMEYEKVFCPLLLVTAKRYSGRKYEFDHTQSSLNSNGLQLVKRDSPELCKHTMKGFFELVLMKNDKKAAGEFVREAIRKLMNDEHPLEHFVLTKKISKRLQDYTVVPPQLVAWSRLVSRIGKQQAPSVGEQFKYIVTRIDKRQKGMAHAMIDIDLAQTNEMQKDIDKVYYLKTFIVNAIRVPMSLILGEHEAASILDINSYDRQEIVSASKGNLLSFFGAKTITTTTKKRKTN